MVIRISGTLLDFLRFLAGLVGWVASVSVRENERGPHIVYTT